MDKDQLRQLLATTLPELDPDQADPGQTLRRLDTFSADATSDGAETFSAGATTDGTPTPASAPSETFSSDATHDGASEAEPAETFSADATTAGGEGATPTPTPVASEPAASPYVRKDEIGRGGMGVIYRARQTGLSRDVALKLILSSSGHAARAFRSEALVTGFLEHPNVVPVHELGLSEAGEPMLAMKLIDGLEWRRLLHPRDDAERARAAELELEGHLDILLRVCDALRFAHDRGIAHLDLKPENVMVGEYGEVLLMDWGIAVAIDPDSETRARAAAAIKSPCGTPSYMAPELADGDGARIGAATDIFLLGALLHEVLTGRPPYAGASFLAVLIQASNAATPRLEGCDAPPELAAICRKAMAKDPTERFSSVADFQAALRDVLRRRENQKQSAKITTEAAAILADCQAASASAPVEGLYARFAEAVVSFKRARGLWPENEAAREGEREARLAYAEQALRREDFGTAEAYAAELEPARAETHELLTRLAAARDEKARRARRNTLVARGLVGAIAAALLILSVSVALVNAARQEEASAKERAVEAQGEERLAREKAQDAEALAEKRRQAAEAAQAQERLAKQREQGERQRAEDRLARLYEEQGRQELQEAQHGRALAFLAEAQSLRDKLGRARSPLRYLINRARKPLEVREALLKGHTAPILALKFSPDGQSLATGSADGSARLWDIASGQERQRFDLKDKVLALAFDRSGERLFMAGPEALPRLVDTRSGKSLALMRRVELYADAFALSDDGRRVATVPRRENGHVVRVREASTGFMISVLEGHSAPIVELAFRPGRSDELLTAGLDGQVLVWKADGARLGALPGHAINPKVDGRAICARYTPDGRRILTVDHQRQARLWDADKRALLKSFKMPRSETSWLFSPDGRRLLVDDELWDLDSGAVVRKVASQIEQAAFHPSSRFLATVLYSEPAVRVWDLETGALIAVDRDGHSGGILALAFGPEGRRLASVGDDRKVRVVRWEALRSRAPRFEVGPFAARGGILQMAAAQDMETWISDDGRRLITLNEGRGGRWTVTDLENGAVLGAAEGAMDATLGAAVPLNIVGAGFNDHPLRASTAFNGSATLVFASGYENKAQVLDVESGAKKAVLKSGGARVLEVAIDPAGRILTRDAAGTARLHDPAALEGPPLKIFKGGPRGWIVAFSRDGRRALSIDQSGGGRLLSADFEERATLSELEGWSLRRVALSPTARYLITLDEDGASALWDGVTGLRLLALSEAGSWTRCRFGPGEDSLIVEGGGPPRLWRLDPPRFVAALRGHTGPVLGLAFRGDGRRVATASEDGTGRVWDGEDGRCLVILARPKRGVSDALQRSFGSGRAGLRSIAFSADGQMILSAGDEAEARLWDAETGRVLAEIGDLGRALSDQQLLARFLPGGAGILVVANHGKGLLASLDFARRPITVELKRRAGWSVENGLLVPAREAEVADQAENAEPAAEPAEKPAAKPGEDPLARQAREAFRRGDAATALAAFYESASATPEDADRARLAAVALGFFDSQAKVAHPHWGRIFARAWSADSRRFLTGGEDEILRVWDAQSGRLIAGYDGHEAALTACAFGPEGGRALSGDAEGRLVLWDLEARTAARTFSSAHRGRVRSVAFDPGGARALSLGRDRRARLWRLADGALLRTFSEDDAALVAAAFDGGGERVLTATARGRVSVRGLEDGRLLFAIEAGSGLGGARFDSAGRVLVWGRSGAGLWGRGGERLTRISGEVREARLIRGREELAVLKEDGELGFWGFDGVKKRAIVKRGLTVYLQDIAVTPDGKRLVSSELSGAVRVWDIDSGGLLQSFDKNGPRGDSTLERWEENRSLGALSLSPDGERYLTQDGGSDLFHGALSAAPRVIGSPAFQSAALFVKGGRRLLSFEKGPIENWDVESGRRLGDLVGHEGAVASVIKVGEDRALSAGADGTARLWSLETGLAEATIKDPDSPLTRAYLDPTGRRLATFGPKASRVWRLSDGALLATLAREDLADQSQPARPPFSDDGARLYTIGGQQAASVWDCLSGRRLLHSRFYLAQAFIEGGRRTAAYAGRFFVEDLASGQRAMSTMALTEDLIANLSLQVSPDEKRFLTHSQGIAAVWDAEARSLGVIKSRVAEHPSAFSSALMAPDGRRVATQGLSFGGPNPDRAALWSVAEERLLLAFPRGTRPLAFGPEGRRLAIASDRGVELWDLEPERAATEAVVRARVSYRRVGDRVTMVVGSSPDPLSRKLKSARRFLARALARPAGDAAELGAVLKDVEAALAAEPGSVEGHRLRGMIRLRQGALSGAEADLTRYLRRAPPRLGGRDPLNFAEAFKLRGIARARLGRGKAAARDFRSSLRRNRFDREKAAMEGFIKRQLPADPGPSLAEAEPVLPAGALAGDLAGRPLKAWLGELASGGPEDKLAAVAAIAAVETASLAALPALRAAARSPAPELRRAALEALAGLEPWGVPELIRGSDDGDRRARRIATRALTEGIGPRSARALGDLRRALGHKSRRVQRAAATAIGRIGPAAAPAIPDLLDFSEGASYAERSRVSGALAAIGSAAIAPSIASLKQEERGRRDAAQAALVDLGSPAIPGLLEVFETGDATLRAQVAELLGAIEGDDRRSERRALWLSGLADPAADVAAACVEALADDPGAGPELAKQLSSEDALRRRRAARALALRSESVAEAREGLEALAGDADAKTRVRALLALGRYPADAALLKLLGAALRDADEGARLAASRSLGRLGSAALPGLEGLVDDAATRLLALDAIAAIAAAGSDAGAAKRLLALGRRQLAAKEPEARELAAAILGALGPAAKAAQGELIAALKDADWRAARSAARALSRLETAEAKAALKRLAEHPVEALRRLAEDGE